ncbi:MAG: hypothetical protein DSZ10_05015 [Sulfurovum sp.]|nr:MAG: hypothetical protein DSZ10_05015 [Sulfurovum sp.]
MQIERRNFLQYLSVLGVLGITGTSLLGSEPKYAFESIGLTYMDDAFDPDGWL